MKTNLLKLELQLGGKDTVFLFLYTDELNDDTLGHFANGLNNQMQALGFRKSTLERAFKVLQGDRAEVIREASLQVINGELMIDQHAVNEQFIAFNETGESIDLIAQLNANTAEQEQAVVTQPVELNEVVITEPVIINEDQEPDETPDQPEQIVYSEAVSNDSSIATDAAVRTDLLRLSNRYQYEARAYSNDELDALLIDLAGKGPLELLNHAIELGRHLSDLQLNKTHLFINDELKKNGFVDLDIFNAAVYHNDDGLLLLSYGKRDYNYQPDADINIKGIPLKAITFIHIRNFYFGDTDNGIEPLTKNKPIVDSDDDSLQLK